MSFVAVDCRIKTRQQHWSAGTTAYGILIFVSEQHCLMLHLSGIDISIYPGVQSWLVDMIAAISLLQERRGHNLSLNTISTLGTTNE